MLVYSNGRMVRQDPVYQSQDLVGYADGRCFGRRLVLGLLLIEGGVTQLVWPSAG